MKVNLLENAILIVLEKTDNINSLKSEIMSDKHSKKNIVIDLNNVIINDFLSIFKFLVENQKNKNKSLVFLTKKNNNNIEDLNVIPTIQEAIDFIFLEEIERDLNLL